MASTVPPVGMPMLSGPPPVIESSSCRKCGKEFNPLWRRAHSCGHCGYEYCSSCLSDGQALMPRRAGGSHGSGSGALAEIRDALGIGSSGTGIGGLGGKMDGYEVEQVCLHCLGMLQVTAAPVQMLRSLPIKRLKEYLAAYDLPCIGPKEKEDFVQAVIKARNPSTGCLSADKESYYRRKSVPKQGQPATSTPSPAQPRRSAPQPSRPFPFSSSTSSSSARPAPAQPRPQPGANAYRPPPPSQARPPPPRPQAQPGYASNPPPPRPAPARPQASTARPTPTQPQPSRPAAAASPTPHPPPPVPTILFLVSLPKSYLSSLSIGTLKAILYDNHVRVDYGQVLEKNELINRVSELIDDERKRLERQRIEEERQSQEDAAAAARRASPVNVNGTTNGSAATGGAGVAGPEGSQGQDKEEDQIVDVTEDGTTPKATPATPAAVAPAPTGPAPDIDRGLCVVCQDEEATLAVVDCGHLAMCAHCSDLVMATSKECPLCRTRIVTPLVNG